MKETSKVNYLLRAPMAGNPFSRNPFGASVERTEKFNIHDTELSVDVMDDVIALGSESNIIELLKNPSIPVAMLENIVSFKHSVILGGTILNHVLSHPNCSTEIIENIFEASEPDDVDVLMHIAFSSKTPVNILLALLPSATQHNDPKFVISHYKHFRTYYLHACLNRYTPASDALHASQWLSTDWEREQVWDARFDDFGAELKNNGLDISDYPMEWVQELVWSGGFK